MSDSNKKSAKKGKKRVKTTPKRRGLKKPIRLNAWPAPKRRWPSLRSGPEH